MRGPASACRIVVLVGVMLLTAAPAWAQPLNEVLTNLFTNNCAALGGSGGPFSPDLARLCPSSPGGPSASGGTASAIDNLASGVDEERRLYRRLKERRQQAASADTSMSRGFSVFASADYENLNKDTTRFETGFRQDTVGATLGGDYAFGTLAVLGAAVHYAHQFGDYKGPGDYDHDRYGITLYGSVTPIDNLFVEGTVGYTRTDYSFSRFAALNTPAGLFSGSTSGDTNGNEFRVGLRGGYDFVFGRFTVGPRLGVNYRNTEIDSYAESGSTGLELAYDRDRVESLTTVAGLFGSVAISTGIGVVIPQVTADYVHEFMNDQRRVDFRLVGDLARRKFSFDTDTPDRDYVLLGVGAVLVLPGGVSPFINYRELLADRDRTSHAVTVGVRFVF